MVKKIFLGFAGASFLCGAAWAGFGASSSFAKVNIGSVEAGTLIRLSARHQPLVVTNTSDMPVTLKLRLKRPPQQEVDSGFEPIPTIEWAVLEKVEFKLAPHESATTDILLRPSSDKKFRDKNYQLHILSRVVSSGNIRIVMTHKLQFSVAKETAGLSMAHEGKTKNKIQPSVVEVKDVALGRLSENSDRVVTVQNNDRQAHRYRIRTHNPDAVAAYENQSMSLNPFGQKASSADGQFSLQPGKQKTMSATNGVTVVNDNLLPRNWISFGIGEFDLKPGEKRKLPVKVFIPPHSALKNKELISLMRITQLDGEYPSTIVPIHIETNGELFDDPAPREFHKPVYGDVRVEIQ